MNKKNKTNSNNNLTHIKINTYPVYPPLKAQIKNFFELKPRKNSVFLLAKFSKHFSRFRNITQEQIIKILSKDKKARIDIENRMIADYLTDHFDYFNQIKQSSRERYLKLISVLNFENIPSNTIIINIGEENNNFYVIFEGTVTVYRHYKYSKDMKFSDFCQYLRKAEMHSIDEYNRIINNNSHLDLNFKDIINDEYYYLSLKNKIFNINIEELEEIGTYSEGYSFGELSLINKKNKDIIIKTVTKCKLISVSKFDFNRILRTIEEKRLEKKAYIFKKSFPIFKLWSMEQLITLFNYCTQEIFHCEEFIYKQNDENDYIYFVEEGSIVQFTNVSFSWYLEFIEYIKDCNENLLKVIKNLNIKANHNLNSGEIHKTLNSIINQLKKENNNKKNYEKYPFFKIKDIYLQRKKDLIKISELYSQEKQTKNVDNFMRIKFEENDLNSPERIYKIPLNSSENPLILGLEETFDLKKRFTTVGCTSGQVRLKKIKIIDLLKILYYYREFNYINNFFDIILQKKLILCQTIKSHLQKIGINFENNMNDKYEKIITQPNISSYKTYKNSVLNNKIKNEVLVATKLKSWNNGSYLDNILDTSLHLINPKTSRQIKLEKKEKYLRINNLFKTKRTSNEKTLCSTKNFFSKIIIRKPNKRIKIKSLDKKEINIRKEKYIDNFFNTSIYPKKTTNKSKNINMHINVNSEEKKNEDKIQMKTLYNYSFKKNKLGLTPGPNNLKKKVFFQPENKKLKKPFKLINYKVSEDYFETNKDNKDTYIDNTDEKSLSCISKEKEKENENVMSVISTNDKDKEKDKDKDINKQSTNNDLKNNLNRNILQSEKYKNEMI